MDKAPHATKHKLILCCLKTLKWPLLGIVGPRLCLLAFTICQPLLLNRLLAFLQNPDEDISIGYGLIGAYALVYLGIAISSALYEHRNARTITMLRGVLVSAVSSRTTELSTVAISNSAAVTLMSTDVSRTRASETMSLTHRRSTPSSGLGGRSTRFGPTSFRLAWLPGC